MTRAILGAGFAAILSALALAAPAGGEAHVEAGGGVFKPMGDSARFFESGYRMELGGEYKLGSNFALMLKAAYNSNRGDTAELRSAKCPPSPPAPAGCSVDEAGAQIFELTLSPKFYLVDNDNLGAYLLAGGGPHWFRKQFKGGYPTQKVDAESSERSFGLHFGFGAEAVLPGPFRLGITPVYHVVFAKTRVRYGAVSVYLKL